MMFGTMLAVVYAVPRHEAWTVCATTTWRPNPITRPTIVIAPIRTAARPIPPPRCRALPRSATGAVTLLIRGGDPPEPPATGGMPSPQTPLAPLGAGPGPRPRAPAAPDAGRACPASAAPGCARLP